jgi:hypothetical protein
MVSEDRILLVSEANLNRNGDDRPALDPDTTYGERLMEILGLEEEDYLTRFERRQLCEYRWQPIKARKMATVILLSAPMSQPIALFGSKITHAFGINYIPFSFKGRYRILPGLGRLSGGTWENQENVEQARRMLGL